jgi:addiction module HigA family antidote
MELNNNLEIMYKGLGSHIPRNTIIIKKIKDILYKEIKLIPKENKTEELFETYTFAILDFIKIKKLDIGMIVDISRFLRKMFRIHIFPGETLLETLKEKGMSIETLSSKIGISGTHIKLIIDGRKSISPRVAKDLEFVLDIKADYWMDLQSKYNEKNI